MKNKLQGNAYDRIFKENSVKLFVPFIEMQLGIEIVKSELLDVKFTRTIERELDFLYKVETADYKIFILHIEFQTRDDPEMIYRISEYHGLILKRNKLPIRHIVIYLGKNKSKMNLELKPQEVFKSFNLISLHEIDHNTLLSSQVPEIVILALLGRYEENEIERVLQAIVYRIQKLVDMEDDRKKYFKQLTILARIRKFEMNTYKILETMTLNYDIEADVLFKKGLEKNRLELEKSRAEAERNRLKAETSILEANEKIESIKEASVLALLKTENLSTSEIVSSLQVSEEWVLQIKSKM